MRQILILILFSLVAFAPSVYGGFWDSAVEKVREVTGPKEAVKTDVKQDGLTDQEILSGLREALDLGVQRAVERASASGGFMDNPVIHIPLPGYLQNVAGTLRGLGLGSQADAFEQTMNQAAEKASGEALPVLAQAVKDLTFEDVRRLWKGGDTAATDYFREKTWQPLSERFQPIVHATSQTVGVTQSYQSLVDHAAVKPLIAGTDLDLDHYVTGKALDGFFTLLAEEEKKIRTDPVARTTDILKKVFGL
jgi:hypothetical protein